MKKPIEDFDTYAHMLEQCHEDTAKKSWINIKFLTFYEENVGNLCNIFLGQFVIISLIRAS